MVDRRLLALLGVIACLTMSACGGSDSPTPPAGNNGTPSAGGATAAPPPSNPSTHTPPSITLGTPSPTTQPSRASAMDSLDPDTAHRIDHIKGDIAAGKYDDADRLLSTLELNKSRFPPEVRTQLSETRRVINQGRRGASTQPSNIDPDSILK